MFVRRTFGRFFDADGETRLCIPYTNQVLDLNLNGGWANGIRIQVYTDWGVRQDNQKWIINTSLHYLRRWLLAVWLSLDPDTTFKHPVTAGGIYRITNRASGTVVHVEDSKKGAFNRIACPVQMFLFKHSRGPP